MRPAAAVAAPAGGIVGSAALCCSSRPRAAPAAELPSGFQDDGAFAGLEEPTAFRFASDGRVFVAEKAGKILVFDDLDDHDPDRLRRPARRRSTTPATAVCSASRSIPQFPASPYVYALYTYDHVLGEDPPGADPALGRSRPTTTGDRLPETGDTGVDACLVSGRLVRLDAAATRRPRPEAAGGEGPGRRLVPAVLLALGRRPRVRPRRRALRQRRRGRQLHSPPDYGQFGWPHENQCGDPPGSVGRALSPPDAEGGALRSQDLARRTTLRATRPASTARDPHRPRLPAPAFAGNPLCASGDANERRIVAYGFRNPFRFAIDPETEEIYVGNVGCGRYEEIDRFAAIAEPRLQLGLALLRGARAPTRATEASGSNLCESLYDDAGLDLAAVLLLRPRATASSPKTPARPITARRSPGSAFYEGRAFPDAYEGALFFADSVRGCIYVMFAGEDGSPDP